jgi:hypothetical protein
MGRAAFSAVGLSLLGCAYLFSQSPSQGAAPATPTTWTIGIARFALASESDRPSLLQETFARLVASDLVSLPARAIPAATARESVGRLAAQAKIGAGADLAAKLDARADSFLQPSLDSAARAAAEDAAQAQVEIAEQKLSSLEAGTGLPQPAPGELRAKLWDGFAKGLLLDPPSGTLAQAAKAAGADLLVTGEIAPDDAGYALVTVRGYDAALDREVFLWKCHCAVDDPGPEAADIAKKLEDWTAGRDFARVELSISPAEAELWVDGERLEGTVPVFYAYSPTTLRFDLAEAGYAKKHVDLEVAPGDRKTLEITLDPVVAGQASISSDPPGAKLSLDSVPIGAAPAEVELDGSRRILTASAKGFEGQSLVLPPSGDQDVAIKLLPSDGLGPGGRIGKAKDDFYRSLGWFALTIPVTSLLAGIYGDYSDAYDRSGSSVLYVSRNSSLIAAWAAGAACATTFVFMIPKLIKYLDSAH